MTTYYTSQLLTTDNSPGLGKIMTAYYTSQLLTTDNNPGLGKISRMRDVYFGIYQKGGGEEGEGERRGRLQAPLVEK